MFTTLLPDVKYKDIAFIAIYNLCDLSAALTHRTSEKSWHTCQSPTYMTQTHKVIFTKNYTYFFNFRDEEASFLPISISPNKTYSFASSERKHLQKLPPFYRYTNNSFNVYLFKDSKS